MYLRWQADMACSALRPRTWLFSYGGQDGGGVAVSRLLRDVPGRADEHKVIDPQLQQAPQAGHALVVTSHHGEVVQELIGQGAALCRDGKPVGGFLPALGDGGDDGSVGGVQGSVVALEVREDPDVAAHQVARPR